MWTASNPLWILLQRLDVLLEREILRLRAAYQLSLDEFRGLYLSDEQVDSLIRQKSNPNGHADPVSDLTARADDLLHTYLAQADPNSAWARLTDVFGLSPFEQDVLLMAVAPELDQKYETLYAYLNNDVTRKRPTRDLALRLFAADRARMQRHLHPGAVLFREGLLVETIHSTDQATWLTRGLVPAQAVIEHVLGIPVADRHVEGAVIAEAQADWADASLTDDTLLALHRLKDLLTQDRRAVLILEGTHGAGRWLAINPLCSDLGMPIIRLDVQDFAISAKDTLQRQAALLLLARLTNAAIYVEHAENLFDSELRLTPEAALLVRRLASHPGLLVYASLPGRSWGEVLIGVRSVSLRFAEPDAPRRRLLWHEYAERAGIRIAGSTSEALADRFILTPGQIRDAVAAAADLSALHPNSWVMTHESLFEAARRQSGQSLGRLAVRVPLLYGWDNLVLPPATFRTVREITGAIQYQRMVYSSWGFQQRVSSIGLKILFAGASGTGKTMTASVIARHLGLDLYKIDLSGVVSKYIGETEKNLDRIFEAARSSNAILFFDEADALFGKRSEVKDAHDRYANIEIAYLLQKLEEHEGVVFLASNLSRNIDQAFSRRMNYVVDFPMPDQEHRERLWQGMFPPEAPLQADVDFAFLAEQFAIAGGDIQTIALDAAFLAAQEGQAIGMIHLIRAMERQMIKQGKIPSSSDFKQYYAWIGNGTDQRGG